VQRKRQYQWNKQYQHKNADSAADKRRGDRHTERFATFPLARKLVPFDHGGDSVRSARYIDQHGRDSATEYTTGVDAEHKTDGDVLRHTGRQPDKQPHGHCCRQPGKRAPDYSKAYTAEC